jgi:hypothetical protein
VKQLKNEDLEGLENALAICTGQMNVKMEQHLIKLLRKKQK